MVLLQYFTTMAQAGIEPSPLLVDSSYELSTEFPGYISPQNLSFDDGSIPLALEHMFSNYSGSTCGEWNASYPLCYPGTSLNTTANASLGEPGDADGLTPRYWALFLLLFPIFTVSRKSYLLPYRFNNATFYHLQKMLWETNAFTGLCLSDGMDIPM